MAASKTRVAPSRKKQGEAGHRSQGHPVMEAGKNQELEGEISVPDDLFYTNM